MDQAFSDLVGFEAVESRTIPVMMGRTLKVPRCANGVARFTFQDLCRSDVFVADYKVSL